MRVERAGGVRDGDVSGLLFGDTGSVGGSRKLTWRARSRIENESREQALNKTS